MSDVVIVGVGQTVVGEHWDIPLRDLALQAIEAARLDAGGLQPQALFIGNMLAPQLSNQAHLGALIADAAGLTGIEAFTLESAGASGGAAIRAGYLALASGQADVALVLGIEKITDKVGLEIDGALATSQDSDYEAVQGLTLSGMAAMLMRRYMQEYDVPRQAFGAFPIIAHSNAVQNPNAMFRSQVKPEAYASASLVSDPMNLFDVAPYADGAAALVLTREELLSGLQQPLVRITGSSLVTDTLALHDRPNPLIFQAAHTSVQRACQKAKIAPMQVDFFELYDAFSIYAALSLETAGFAELGSGWRLAQDGQISLHGSLPISTMGGLKARGNPGGATGVYQAVEAVLQLRGQAGANQIPGARRGMIQCLGGPASSAATHILESVI